MSADADWKRLIESRLDDLGDTDSDQWDEINELKRWRSWLVGAAAALGLFAGIFAKGISHLIQQAAS